jgi:hypothetical protein
MKVKLNFKTKRRIIGYVLIVLIITIVTTVIITSLSISKNHSLGLEPAQANQVMGPALSQSLVNINNTANQIINDANNAAYPQMQADCQTLAGQLQTASSAVETAPSSMVSNLNSLIATYNTAAEDCLSGVGAVLKGTNSGNAYVLNQAATSLVSSTKLLTSANLKNIQLRSF